MDEELPIGEIIVSDSELIMDKARKLASEFMFEHSKDPEKNLGTIFNNMTVLEFTKLRANWVVSFHNIHYPGTLIIVHHDAAHRMSYLDWYEQKTCASVHDHRFRNL